MKKNFHLGGIVALSLLSTSAATIAQTATTSPVGYITIDIDKATPSGRTFTYVASSLSPETGITGNITSGSTGTITDTNLSLTDDQYSIANGPFYIITEDGDIYDITSNTSDTFTLASSENLSSLVSKSFKVYKHQTLNSIFGSDPEINGVTGSTSPATADQVQIYDANTGSYKSYYYKNATTFPNNTLTAWVASDDSTTDAGNTILDPDLGFLYSRYTQEDLAITVTGNVITNTIAVPIVEGYNLVTVPYPVDTQLTLGNAGLYGDPFDINTHLEGSTSPSTADQILIWNGTTFDAYYYKNGTTFPNNTLQGWVKTTDNTTDYSDTVIPEGGFFILRRDGNPDFTWNFSDITE